MFSIRSKIIFGVGALATVHVVASSAIGSRFSVGDRSAARAVLAELAGQMKKLEIQNNFSFFDLTDVSISVFRISWNRKSMLKKSSSRIF